MKALLTTFFTLCLIPIAHAETGFSRGNDLEITVYRGRVHIFNCPGHTSYYCSGADYNPGTHDRFVFSQRVNADRVELTALREDGSTKTKKKKFDSNKGTSKKFNLLTKTLFQSPLLKLGTNKISYKLTKKRSKVADGEFEANVTLAGELSCPDLSISGWGTHCENAASACNEYFNRVTGCQ